MKPKDIQVGKYYANSVSVRYVTAIRSADGFSDQFVEYEIVDTKLSWGCLLRSFARWADYEMSEEVVAEFLEKL